MELPTVVNILRDRERRVTYRVLAYRKLTPDEIISAVAHARIKPKRGMSYEITTIIGFDEPAGR